ncbi:HIT family protein [Oscillatoria sp. CS-180]|uniref:HIT family protein n=1 Tax=Oscillatoria sp. CS-180 TaxID=3021720 RepID=UPI00232F7480|nr:HIT family protein [Oscillatoria sp. CS-180]MDB9526315.1 HIT family protein [Oscillatoria sp. CS-180]
MNDLSNCVFCRIVAGSEPASVIFEDDRLIAFMGIRPIRPGECMVIPKRHIDHFTDIDDETSQRIILVAQHIGRRIREVFKPQRVGMIVHGYGVPHAHLILVPQHDPYDITSARLAYLENGGISFGMKNLPFTDRVILDKHAQLLRIDNGSIR